MNQQFHIGDLIKFDKDGAEIEGRIKKLPQFNIAIVEFSTNGITALLTVNLDLDHVECIAENDEYEHCDDYLIANDADMENLDPPSIDDCIQYHDPVDS